MSKLQTAFHDLIQTLKDKWAHLPDLVGELETLLHIHRQTNTEVANQVAVMAAAQAGAGAIASPMQGAPATLPQATGPAPVIPAPQQPDPPQRPGPGHYKGVDFKDSDLWFPYLQGKTTQAQLDAFEAEGGVNVPKPIQGDAISTPAPSAPTPEPTPEPTPVPGPVFSQPAGVYMGPFTDVAGNPLPVETWQQHEGVNLLYSCSNGSVAVALPGNAGSVFTVGDQGYPELIEIAINKTPGSFDGAVQVSGVNGGSAYVVTQDGSQYYVNLRYAGNSDPAIKSAVKWGK